MQYRLAAHPRVSARFFGVRKTWGAVRPATRARCMHAAGILP